MPRLCSVCTHPQRDAINVALLERKAGHWGGGYGAIARRFGLVKASIQRHEQSHLRDLLAHSKEAAMLASSESLIAEMNRLHEYVNRVLERGEAKGDDDLVLRGVSQGQRNVETLARFGPVSEIEQRVKALEQGSGQRGSDQS